MILRHPWVASVLGQVGTTYLGPNVMGLTDRMLGPFEAAGFSLEEADLALTAVFSYVIGWGITEAAWMTALSRSGLTEREWAERTEPMALQAAKPYPRLTRLYEKAVQNAGAGEREDNFVYGLNRMLDGIQAKL